MGLGILAWMDLAFREGLVLAQGLVGRLPFVPNLLRKESATTGALVNTSIKPSQIPRNLSIFITNQLINYCFISYYYFRDNIVVIFIQLITILEDPLLQPIILSLLVTILVQSTYSLLLFYQSLLILNYYLIRSIVNYYLST